MRSFAALPLFEPDPAGSLVLADGEHGRVTYEPGFLDSARALECFDDLRRDAAWNASKRVMYEREVDVPRLTASYRLDVDEPARPPCLAEIGRRVSTHLGVPFTNVGLNLYRDGRDSVAPHNDHLGELVRGFPIALISLGATRRMSVRSKTDASRSFDVDLEAGSLFVMGYETQIHYLHGIPKTEAAVGPRISLAFRVRTEPGRGWAGYGFSSSIASISRATSPSST